MGLRLTDSALLRMRCHLSLLLIALSLIPTEGKSAAPAIADLVLTNGRVFTGSQRREA